MALKFLQSALATGWTGDSPARAQDIPPLKIKAKLGAQPVQICQYPLSLAARQGLKPLIHQFQKYGWLHDVQSSLILLF